MINILYIIHSNFWSFSSNSSNGFSELIISYAKFIIELSSFFLRFWIEMRHLPKSFMFCVLLPMIASVKSYNLKPLLSSLYNIESIERFLSDKFALRAEIKPYMRSKNMVLICLFFKSSHFYLSEMGQYSNNNKENETFTISLLSGYLLTYFLCEIINFMGLNTVSIQIFWCYDIMIIQIK